MIHAIADKQPSLGADVFVAWNAEVAGDVTLADKSSVWFGATLRADVAAISVGRRSNVQDGTVVHVDRGVPCIIGDDVTIGHNAVVHACRIGNRCLIGMGAIVLDGAVIGDECIVGAGALVTQGKEFPPRSLIIGSPAKAVRQVTADELEHLRKSAEVYAQLALTARTEYRELAQ